MDWLKYLGWTTDDLLELRSVGYCYMKEGKYEIAISFFEAALIFSKEDHYDLQMLGALYLQVNKNLDALKILDKALRKKPKDYISQLNRAKALFSLGYHTQAIAQAKQLILSGEKEIAERAQALLLSQNF